jgi:large subunit ribosomal protein L13
MTPFIKKKEIQNNWYLINAENAVVGRLAAYISKALRGKNKATYNPHMDNGDFVVVTNIEKMKFSGKKFTKKFTTGTQVIQVVLKKIHPLDLRRKIKLKKY